MKLKRILLYTICIVLAASCNQVKNLSEKDIEYILKDYYYSKNEPYTCMLVKNAWYDNSNILVSTTYPGGRIELAQLCNDGIISLEEVDPALRYPKDKPSYNIIFTDIGQKYLTKSDEPSGFQVKLNDWKYSIEIINFFVRENEATVKFLITRNPFNITPFGKTNSEVRKYESQNEVKLVFKDKGWALMENSFKN